MSTTLSRQTLPVQRSLRGLDCVGHGPFPPSRPQAAWLAASPISANLGRRGLFAAMVLRTTSKLGDGVVLSLAHVSGSPSPVSRLAQQKEVKAQRRVGSLTCL